MHKTRKPVASWHEHQRELREDAVLDAAAELMGAHGYAHTTMDQIAERVGISKPTLYQHFRSKNAIVEGVMLRNQANAEIRLAAIEEHIAGGERARTQLEQHMRDAIGVYQGLWASRAQIPTAVRDARKLRVRRERIWERYARIIDRCKTDGDCRRDVPTPLLVRSVVRVFRGDYADLLDDGTITLEELAYALVSLLFDGMAPREPAPNGEHASHAAGARVSATAGDASARRPAKPNALGAVTATILTVASSAVFAAAPLLAQRAPATHETNSAIALGAPQTRAAQEGRPLTLADVLDAALRANPTAQAAVAEARVAADNLAAARGSWLPTVSFVPAFVVSQSNTGTGLNAAASGQRVTFSPSLNLSYLLFDLGGRAGTVGAARQTSYATRFTRDNTLQATVLAAEQAYFSYQSAEAVLEAQTENVRTATENRDAAVGRFQAGLATVADTLQASTALAQARVSLVVARTSLVTARASLATVMGARADVPFRVAVEPAPTASDVGLVTAELTQRVDTLIAHALRARPDANSADALTQAATERVQVARSAQLPSLQLSVGSGRVIANQPSLTGGTYNVQVGFSLPLFDGGTRRANVNAARAEVDATRARADAIDNQIVNDVVTAADGLKLVAEQVTTTDELLASAIASADVAQGRYREGVGSIVDLITAQTALATARSQAAQARWGWASSLSQLSRSAGVLGARGELPVTAPSIPRTTLTGASVPASAGHLPHPFEN